MDHHFPTSMILELDLGGLWRRKDSQDAIMQAWFDFLIRQLRPYYAFDGFELSVDHLETVRQQADFEILDPFERYDMELVVDDAEELAIQTADGPNPVHLADFADSPLVVSWARDNPVAATAPMSLPTDDFAYIRLRFFRRVHRWVYLTYRLYEGYQVSRHYAISLDFDPEDFVDSFAEYVSNPLAYTRDALLDIMRATGSLPETVEWEHDYWR